MAAQASVELFSPAFTADPHPTLLDLRETSPVRQIVLPDGEPAWLVTRYDDARQALADPRLSKRSVDGLPPGSCPPICSSHMLATDPPDHTRLRRLVSAAFTVRRVEALRPRIQQITDQLLDEMAGHDQVDLIDAFAFPLPVQVIGEFLGVPMTDRESLRDWTMLVVSATGHTQADGCTAVDRYARELIASKRAKPGDDLLSALIEVEDNSDRLTDTELTAMVYVLLIAGHETTVNLIANGTLLLLTERERWERLRAQPALLVPAVEEFLRFESPVQSTTFRITTETVELGGQVIPAGHQVVISLLSANRDESRFPDASRMELGRADNQHLAFGHGLHFCLGAPLARLEAQVAFGALPNRFPGMHLAVPPSELTWRSGALLRALTRLPVTLR